MENNKRLLKNTLIYFIGTFGSKLLIFFLLPLYSQYLSLEEYGTVNLITNIVPLIGPIFTLQISECVFRFLCDCDGIENKKKYVSNSFFILTIGMLFFLFLYIPLSMITDIRYRNIFMLYFIFNYLGIYFQQILRGFHMNIDYVVTGVISTLVQLVLNILLIRYIYEESILISMLASSILITLYAFIRLNLFNYIDSGYISVETIKEMINYTLPLVPNQISWWLNGTAGLYILKYYYGDAGVGIVSFASKFPSIITVVNNIFLLAWSENTIYEYNTPDISNYYTKNLERFTNILLVFTALVLPATKIYFSLGISETYNESLNLIPLLAISVVFSAIASFNGALYTASKRTMGALSTTIVAAIINITIALIFVPKYGVYGYALANCISNFAFYLVRKRSVNKIIYIKEDYNKYIFSIGFFAMSCYAMYNFSSIANVWYISISITILAINNIEKVKKFLFQK